MPKKTVKTKKPLKTVIVKVPKMPSFDLSFEKTAENTKIIVALENLKASGGWQFLTQVFEENIKFIGNQIICKTNSDGKTLEEIEVDRLRDRYSYLKELLAKPDFFLKKLKANENITIQEDNDPYQK